MSDHTPFAFKAVRRDGTIETGIVEASDRGAAAALIGSRGAFAIQVTAEAPAPHARLRISADDLALGLRALATLLGYLGVFVVTLLVNVAIGEHAADPML